MKYKIFISHSSSDTLIANSLIDLFEKNGLKCWIAPRNIGAGRDYGEEIMNGINSSTIFLLIFTKAANISKHVKREVERAVHLDKILVPLKIDDTLPSGGMDYYLSTLQWLEAQETSKYPKVLQDALEILHVATARERIINNSEIVVPEYIILNVCTKCGNQYAEHDPSGCSYHSEGATIIGNTGGARDYADIWQFPCCGQKYVGTFTNKIVGNSVEGTYDVSPPNSPGCNKGYHTPKYLFSNRNRML